MPLTFGCDPSTMLSRWIAGVKNNYELFAITSCNNGDRISVNKTEIDSLRNQVRELTAGNDTFAKHLVKFDTLDNTVFSNQGWTRLHESHSKEIKVF